MVITYNANMTAAARRRRKVGVQYFWEFLQETAQKIFVSLYHPSITRENESKALSDLSRDLDTGGTPAPVPGAGVVIVGKMGYNSMVLRFRVLMPGQDRSF